MYEKKLTLKLGLVSTIIMVILSCASHSHKGTLSANYSPPGSIKLNDTTFIDQYEVSNIAYREFMFSMKSIFGQKSPLYLTMIPDSKVWAAVEHIQCGEEEIELNPATTEMLESAYHRSYMFSNFPIVGVSFQQAKNFCTWRTNAVNAALIKKEGKIKKGSRFDFTLMDHLNYLQEQGKIDSFKRYPIFLLPDEDILEELEYLDNFNPRSKNIICESFQNEESSFFMLTKNKEYNKYGPIENLSGNLVEMTAVDGIAYGGSWLHNADECSIAKRQYYSEPSAWLGFRCAVVMMTFSQIQDYFLERSSPEEVMISKF